MIKIAKFGGSSVADAEHFKKIKAIVDADPARRFVVVSACGRRFKGDTKVTDLLYLVNAHVKYHVSCEELLEDIGQRYFDIADELELTYPIREEFAAFAERARSGGYSTEELVSRGEYFTARLMAEGMPEKQARAKASKQANEDARFVLPNACETKMILTMNVRSLRNFFRLRCCNRAQWEIRAVATEMLRLCCEVSPALFRTAGPSCYCGGCTEGKMSCGKAKEVREKFEVIHGETR